MTGPKQKSASDRVRKKPGPRAGGSANYVYCIIESSDVEGIVDSAPEGLEAGTRVGAIASGSMAAVISAVPLSQYGEGALKTNLSDAAWAASRVMRHERVVEYFASRSAAIPLRFGTIYTDKKDIGQMLEDRAAELSSLIERLRDKEEWGVLIYCDQAKLIESTAAVDPSIRPLLKEVETATPGQSYLLSKQIRGLKTRAAREEISAALAQMRESLAGSADASAANSQTDRRESEYGTLIAKLSFLVRRDRFNDFQATAERLAESFTEAGLHLELVGPLPPYSFVREPGDRRSGG